MFSKREEEVVALLLQGKGNKQMALALGISERTVEFHLNHIYEKLDVRTRAEAILRLGESTGAGPEESTVGGSREKGYGDDTVKWTFEREARFPDEHTVGVNIPRANSFSQEVHGLFGAVQAWPARSGYARYENIRIPNTGALTLRLRYSKHTPSTVPILVYLDREKSPRARIIPQDQKDWDHFVWTDPIPLGQVKSGVHSLTFSTEGQEYGVADLDKFTLMSEP